MPAGWPQWKGGASFLLGVGAGLTGIVTAAAFLIKGSAWKWSKVIRCGKYEVEIVRRGAAIRRFLAPDERGNVNDVVVGWDNDRDYCKQSSFAGVVVGRVANRIAGGKLRIGRETYQLTRNENGVNHHHGGEIGLHKAAWHFVNSGEDFVQLSFTDLEGNEGYPGSVTVTVTYALQPASNDSVDLVMDMEISASEEEQATVANPAQHTYWNLAGHEAGPGSAGSMKLSLPNSYEYLPVTSNMVPTGEIKMLTGTKYNLATREHTIDQIGSLDTYFFVGGERRRIPIRAQREAGSMLQYAAALRDPHSRRRLDVWTDAPGVQVFTEGVPESIGKGGVGYGPRCAVAIEPHWPPDAQEHSRFPSIELPPGQTAAVKTIFRHRPS